jgi:hypothetical protein
LSVPPKPAVGQKLEKPQQLQQRISLIALPREVGKPKENK